MRAEKIQQLTALLKAVPPGKAAELARAIQAMGEAGAAGLPTELLLDALGPALRASRRDRCSLRRMACMPLEPFLADDSEQGAIAGIVSRAVLTPWWEAVAQVAGKELAAMQAELEQLMVGDDEAALDGFAMRARAAAAGWTQRIIALAKDANAPPVVRTLLKTPQNVEAVKQIEEILSVAEQLAAGVAAVMDAVAKEGKLSGTRILDLTPSVVGAAKRCYNELGDSGGNGGRYFGLAILNRLDKPWHIFRLARALSWKRDALLVANTELGVIGLRLLQDLERLAAAVDAGNPRGKMSAHLVDFDALRGLVGRYIEGAEGLIEEIDMRRDSQWGEMLLRSRTAMREALDEDRLDTAIAAILAVLPEREPAGSKQRIRAVKTPSEERPAAELQSRAQQAVQFLMFLAQRASRQGFSSAAKKTIEELCETVHRRGEDLIADLRADPNDAGARAQLEPAIALVGTLFQDERGKILARRLTNELNAR